jgi:F0F1-type ATP synthase assembly protein I
MKKKSRRIPSDVAALLHLGWTIAISLTGFSLLGIYLDKKFDSTPLATLIFCSLGIIVAGYLFFSSVAKITGERQKDKNLPE